MLDSKEKKKFGSRLLALRTAEVPRSRQKAEGTCTAESDQDCSTLQRVWKRSISQGMNGIGPACAPGRQQGSGDGSGSHHC
jgi:hypothetical protein